MKLSAPLRIVEVAELLGWSYKRAKAWLLALHEESGGTLLEGGGIRPYTVTLAALARVRPDTFAPPPGLEARVEEADERAARIEAQQLTMATALGAIRRELATQRANPRPSPTHRAQSRPEDGSVAA